MKLVLDSGDELELNCLELKSTDILILKHPGRLGAYGYESLRIAEDFITKAFGFEVKIVLLEEGMDLEILRKEVFNNAN